MLKGSKLEGKFWEKEFHFVCFSLWKDSLVELLSAELQANVTVSENAHYIYNLKVCVESDLYSWF